MRLPLLLRRSAIAALALLLALPALAQTVLIQGATQAPQVDLNASNFASSSSGPIAVRTGPDPHEAHGWDWKTSHTECGGLRRDGKPQAPCKVKPANYMGPALGKCPDGSFFDIGLWQCWSCDKSKGFSRTASVSSPPAS